MVLEREAAQAERYSSFQLWLQPGRRRDLVGAAKPSAASSHPIQGAMRSGGRMQSNPRRKMQALLAWPSL